MMRWLLGLTVVSCVTVGSWERAGAVERRRPAEDPQPRRVIRGSYLEYVVIRQQGRPVRVKQVYSGYSAHFPPPALLYYGYPHSGDDTGIGPLWGP
jgi:hypothetical protein